MITIRTQRQYSRFIQISSNCSIVAILLAAWLTDKHVVTNGVALLFCLIVVILMVSIPSYISHKNKVSLMADRYLEEYHYLATKINTFIIDHEMDKNLDPTTLAQLKQNRNTLENYYNEHAQ